MPLSMISGSVMGALIGLAGTLLASYGLYYHKQNKRRKHIRIALLTEIKQMQPRINTLNKHIDMDVPVKISGDPIHTHVYESNVGELSLLTQEEIAAVSSFYTHGIAVQRKIEQTSNDSEVTPGLAMLNAAVPGLAHKMDVAIRQLERNCSEFDEVDDFLKTVRDESGAVEKRALKN